jgi:mRNA interferase YafQ
MRMIDRTNRFKKDYKRETKGRSAAYVAHLDAEPVAVVAALAADAPLEQRHHDHALTGDREGCRDCHIGPTSCSFTASLTTTRWNWSALDRTANLTWLDPPSRWGTPGGTASLLGQPPCCQCRLGAAWQKPAAVFPGGGH